MGPQNDLNSIIKALDFGNDTTRNCTDKTGFPTLGFVIDGKEFQMRPDDYMDRSRDPTMPKGLETCWAHLMPIGDTGRGPVFVLGMPFLRTFYTAYDVKAKKIGIALANHSSAAPKPPAQAANQPLIAVRPGGEDLGGNSSTTLSNKKRKQL